MAEAAERFRAVLLATPGCVVQRVAPAVPQRDGVEWSNLLIAAPSFRHGHVETFVVPGRVSVLHVCLFPQLDDPAPIYGFDMVAGPARVTGIFLDLSPVVPGATVPRLPDIVGSTQLAGFTEARTLPTWGDVFSPDMLAVRPTDVTEVVRAIGLAEAALAGWLGRPIPPPGQTFRPDSIAAGQARYVAAQRRNEHTFRMLSGFVGIEAARRFIEDVLFPPVPCLGSLPSQAA
jgi:phycocyanobilin:ferredoxin oxidoreductase